MKLLRHRDATPPSRLERKFLHFWQSLDGTIRNVILSKPIELPLHGIGTRVTFIHGNRDPVTDIIRVHEVAAAVGGTVIEVEGDHGGYIGPATDRIKRELSSASITGSQ